MDIKKEKRKLRDRLKNSQEEMLLLLYSGEYTWSDKNKILDFINCLLKDIDQQLWSRDLDEVLHITGGHWNICLYRDPESYARIANLSYIKDDHTAMVIEDKNGGFIDLDIGGS